MHTFGGRSSTSLQGFCRPRTEVAVRRCRQWPCPAGGRRHAVHKLTGMKADEIRERFLSFFEERGHLRMPSASLVPPSYDPSVLLTTAGMQPFKPYFRGEEEPPSKRLTSCQKSFRTVDIEVVGTTKRHLTFFEMLGNFSVGDYFKQGAAEYAWELSTQGFGFDPDKVWITVFGGDEELGLGPDSEAIEVWRSIGIPDDRIVLLGREDNFWQAGPDWPVRAVLRALLRPRPRLRPRHRPSRRRHRPLGRVLEPRLHAVRPPVGRLAPRPPLQEHRHRHGARPHGGDPPGRLLGLRDRALPPDDRARRGALRAPVRPGLRRPPARCRSSPTTGVARPS